MVLRSEESEDDDEFELLLETWKNEVKDYVRRKNALEHNLATLHKVTCGQCAEQVKTKLKEHENFGMSIKIGRSSFDESLEEHMLQN